MNELMELFFAERARAVEKAVHRRFELENDGRVAQELLRAMGQDCRCCRHEGFSHGTVSRHSTTSVPLARSTFSFLQNFHTREKLKKNGLHSNCYGEETAM